MKKEIVTCDRCGKEINLWENGYYQYSHDKIQKKHSGNYACGDGCVAFIMPQEPSTRDICDECDVEVWKKVIKVMKKCK